MPHRFTFVVPLFLIITGLCLRLGFINLVPPGFYYDEMDNVFTGEAVARFGTDITGNWKPLSLTPLKTVNITAELPALLHVPFQKIFGYGAQSGHLPNALYGILTAAISMALAQTLFKKPRLSLLVFGLVLTNPWHVHVSRTAYEAPLSLFFQILLIYGWSLLADRQKVRGLALILVGIFGGYFTYHGAKITTPLLVMAGSVISLARNRSPKNWRQLGLPVTLTVILVVYSLSLYQNSTFGARATELFNRDYLTEIVDTRRRQSIDLPLKSLVINKFTVLTEEVVKRYFFVFDFNRLFTRGTENTFQFSLFVFPYFYLSTLPLLVLGLIYSYSHFRRQFGFLFVFLAVSPVTSSLTIGYQATFRSGLTYLILLIFAAVGAFSILSRLKFVGKVIVLGIFILETALFGINYFGRYPIIAADNHHFWENSLASYISRVNEPVTIVSQTPYVTARALVSYLRLMPEMSSAMRQNFVVSTQNFDVSDRLRVTTDCPSDLTVAQTFIFDPDSYARCADLIGGAATKVSLGSPIDSRAYYFLVNDTLCEPLTLASYVHPTKLKQFGLGTLTNLEFCSTWVQKN